MKVGFLGVALNFMTVCARPEKMDEASRGSDERSRMKRGFQFSLFLSHPFIRSIPVLLFSLQINILTFMSYFRIVGVLKPANVPNGFYHENDET
jgi:hypothetical protein